MSNHCLLYKTLRCVHVKLCLNQSNNNNKKQSVSDFLNLLFVKSSLRLLIQARPPLPKPLFLSRNLYYSSTRATLASSAYSQSGKEVETGGGGKGYRWGNCITGEKKMSCHVTLCCRGPTAALACRAVGNTWQESLLGERMNPSMSLAAVSSSILSLSQSPP